MTIADVPIVLMKQCGRIAACMYLGLQFSAAASAQTLSSPQRSYSPNADQGHPMQVFWGDTHLHTSHSFDAGGFGNSNLGREDAYRFARGEVVTAHNGMKVRLNRPLDFLVIADHAEYLGVLPSLHTSDEILLQTAAGKAWKELYEKGGARRLLQDLVRVTIRGEDALSAHPTFKKSVWQSAAETADHFNSPGRFTTLIGFEWTSMPNGSNLHRNVIFLDDATKATQVLPFSALNSERPEDLWRYMDRYERLTGGQVLAIPHNPNVSGGLMFAPHDSDGRPFTQEYAKARARWEPLIEVTQIKGDSETHPFLSPDDEFADFGRWVGKLSVHGESSHQDWMYAAEYARSALKSGLKHEQRLGVNPLKFGMIGSTDSHTSLATAEENNFWGKLTINEPSPTRVRRAKLEPEIGSGRQTNDTGEERNAFRSQWMNWDLLASGYAALWAEENTREALFAAMRRKEVYATTGPRIVVRFFGGWSYEDRDAFSPQLARIGYRKGVPMGGDLTNGPLDHAPTFLVHAAKDPGGANLDRIQIIKGWVDAGGQTKERIYDVAASGGRQASPAGRVRLPVGNTVDLAGASYTNSIGAPELAAVWRDPDFDQTQLAFYYARVLEIPTPTWLVHDAAFFQVELPAEAPRMQQERAYTSPIWYTPAHAHEAANEAAAKSSENQY